MLAIKKKVEVDVDAMWKNFFKTHSEQARNRLMEHYLPIVKYTAERIYVKLPDKVEVDDLISAGIFGLMDAIDAFDPERGVKFATYCTPRIRGSIL
ncbi:MAG: sigma-70 family RNA polymerase sigma factor, partial [Phycisphaerae bacterium]|nr:sigma-70 family RNA polymerase sigma factor [Phycisphaerae bacterium]